GVVTIDVAFISLRLILPALPPFLEPGADVVALVKPQFEAGREEVGRHGIVTDPLVHEAVLARVTEAAITAGFSRVALTPSPITGARRPRGQASCVRTRSFSACRTGSAAKRSSRRQSAAVASCCARSPSLAPSSASLESWTSRSPATR